MAADTFDMLRALLEQTRADLNRRFDEQRDFTKDLHTGNDRRFGHLEHEVALVRDDVADQGAQLKALITTTTTTTVTTGTQKTRYVTWRDAVVFVAGVTAVTGALRFVGWLADTLKRLIQ